MQASVSGTKRRFDYHQWNTNKIITYGGMLRGTFGTFERLAGSPAGPDTVSLSIDYGSGNNDKVGHEQVEAISQTVSDLRK